MTRAVAANANGSTPPALPPRAAAPPPRAPRQPPHLHMDPAGQVQDDKETGPGTPSTECASDHAVTRATRSACTSRVAAPPRRRMLRPLLIPMPPAVCAQPAEQVTGHGSAAWRVPGPETAAQTAAAGLTARPRSPRGMRGAARRSGGRESARPRGGRRLRRLRRRSSATRSQRSRRAQRPVSDP